MSNTKKSLSRWKIASFLAVVALLGATFLAAFNIERIQDTISYHQYEPTSSIAALADKSGMNDRGRFLFYASQPTLDSRSEFNRNCASLEKTAAILGCYDGLRIYIYDIDDSRLAGIRSTTAAHEMLHAAYRRLSEADRLMVNRLLEAEYDKLKHDEDLSERMAFYARTQPGERENELHSIIGTEVSDIGAELEQYYKRYFEDRSKVVAQRQQYYSVFAKLTSQADDLKARIDTLEAKIGSNRSVYSARSASLQRDIDSFNRRAEQGEFENQAVFNEQRQALVFRSTELESLRTNLNRDISEYNRLIGELEAIATETGQLNSSLNSSIEPGPAL